VSKRSTSLKSGYLSTVGLSRVKMVAERYITSTGDELFRIVNIDDLE